VPETIGAITWLSKNESKIKKIKHGLVASCVGDPGISSYKKSRQGNAIIDQAAINVLKNSGENYKIIDFSPIGSDERQYCSPGFNMPIGSLQRTIPPDFPEYHTSADDTNFVQRKYLANTFSKYLSVIHILENNKTYVNLNPKCEPQLGKTGLYRMIGGPKKLMTDELAILWVLNYSDGEHSLLDISDVSGIKFEQIKIAANALINCNLLKEKNIRD
jgi:aminopeptidase-like protein